MTENKGKEYWTQEEIDASVLTVALVDEDGNVVKRLKGEAAKKAEAEYMHALEVSSKMLGF